MNVCSFLSYFAKNLSVNRDKSSISQNLSIKICSSSMAFETECISRPNLGTSADVPDVSSPTSMLTHHTGIVLKGYSSKMIKYVYKKKRTSLDRK